MPAVLERLVQPVAPGKWGDLEILDKDYDALEAKYGFPQKLRLQCVAGGLSMDAVIIQRVWPSLAVMEDAYGRLMQDPEWVKLGARGNGIIKENFRELYIVLPM